MCREQKTEPGELGFGYPFGDRVEPEEPKGARSIGTPEATAVGGVELLGKMLSINNMIDTCERVVANRRFENGGAAGVDGMRVEELQPYRIKQYRELSRAGEEGGNPETEPYARWWRKRSFHEEAAQLMGNLLLD
ncbi:MAG: hypothetical protein LBB98_06885 [Treponema sp.]|jgi:hypothetical protein|nr:hypothetical protein [Treponema sp.]